jgi:hypothetical protein
MGKDKNKVRNNEEEIKLGENSLRKLVEVYSYNVVVDQFFMKTSKKIVEIDKILRNLKNKTGSAFVAKFLYENRQELSNLCKASKDSNYNFFQEKPKNEKRFLDKKRRKIKRKLYLDEINEGEKKLEREERRKKNLSNKDIENIPIKGISSKSKENNRNSHSLKDKSIYAHLLLNSYANKNSLEYLPEKTIEERINSMREKIFAVFPELQIEKINEEVIENENQKKKEISSVNDSHSTKEIDII